MSSFLLYLAKPTYGGWVTFTAHLSLKYAIPLYKISSRTEKKERPYGYNVNYKNINIDSLKELINMGHKPIITAIDKNFYHILDIIPDGSTIVIHDPTEFNKKQKKIVLDNLNRLNVIVIRKTVQDLLLRDYGIQSTFKPHPYVSSLSTCNNKNGAISISRIDYDKNIEMIVKANAILPLDKRIEIYGEPNELYIYRKLKEYDHFNVKELGTMYRGHFPKDFSFLSNLLSCKKYVVDCSTIHQDGGGTQYTFLEAIDAGCILILNKKWVNSPHSIWKDGVNCFAIDNAEELANLLINEVSNTKKIIIEAKKIMEFHEIVDWTDII
jgi:glycosyltransferase involved in cell wall biosynthesis